MRKHVLVQHYNPDNKLHVKLLTKLPPNSYDTRVLLHAKYHQTQTTFWNNMNMYEIIIMLLIIQIEIKISFHRGLRLYLCLNIPALASRSDNGHTKSQKLQELVMKFSRTISKAEKQ